jgi:hypothetical protein
VTVVFRVDLGGFDERQRDESVGVNVLARGVRCRTVCETFGGFPGWEDRVLRHQRRRRLAAL